MHSFPIFQQLANAMIHNLWQSTSLWMAFQLWSLISNGNSRERYYRLVLFHFLILFSFIANLYLLEASGIEQTFLSNQFSLTRLTTFKNYLGLCYLFILVWGIGKWIIEINSASRLFQSDANSFHAYWQNYVTSLTNQWNLPQEIKLYFSHQIKIPMTLGILKPVILLPISILSQLSSIQIEALIIHELSHIKRNDYFLNLLIRFSNAILWFNPFAHLFSRLIAKEREFACDDFVLANHRQPIHYVEALLSLAKQTDSPQIALSATGNPKDLLERIQRILMAQKNGRNNPYPIILGFISILLLVFSFQQPRKYPTEKIAYSPLVNITAQSNNFELLTNEANQSKVGKPTKKINTKSPLKNGNTFIEKLVSVSAKKIIPPAPVSHEIQLPKDELATLTVLVGQNLQGPLNVDTDSSSLIPNQSTTLIAPKPTIEMELIDFIQQNELTFSEINALKLDYQKWMLLKGLAQKNQLDKQIEKWLPTQLSIIPRIQAPALPKIPRAPITIFIAQ